MNSRLRGYVRRSVGIREELRDFPTGAHDDSVDAVRVPTVRRPRHHADLRRFCAVASLFLVSFGLALFLIGDRPASLVLWLAALVLSGLRMILLMSVVDQAAAQLEDAILKAKAEEKVFGISNPDYGKVYWRELDAILRALKGEDS